MSGRALLRPRIWLNSGNAQRLDASRIHQNLDSGYFIGKENSIRAVAWGGAGTVPPSFFPTKAKHACIKLKIKIHLPEHWNNDVFAARWNIFWFHSYRDQFNRYSRGWTQFLKLVGFAGKLFLLSPPPSLQFHFWLLSQLSRWTHPETLATYMQAINLIQKSQIKLQANLYLTFYLNPIQKIGFR